MAYNFENVTPYVSTSNQTAANNQMLVSGFQNSMKTFQALEQQRLKDNAKKNALLDADIKNAEAAWSLSVGEARKTGKVVDLDSKLKDLKSEYYRLNQSRKDQGANVSDIDYKLSQILTMPDNLKNLVENLGVDGTEWSNRKPGQTNPAQDPKLSMFLNTVTQAKTFEAPVYDEIGNLLTSGYRQDYGFDLDTYSWNLKTSKVDANGEMEFYTINSNSYEAMDMGLYNPVEGPLNAYTSAAEEIGIFETSEGEDGNMVQNHGKLNSKYIKNAQDGGLTRITLDATPGSEIYQMQRVVDMEMIKADMFNKLSTGASAYLVNPSVAATAWNQNFVKQKPIDGKGNAFIPKGEDEKLYEMWDENEPLTDDKRKLLTKQYSEAFYTKYKNTGIFESVPEGISFGPGKSRATNAAVSNQVTAFKNNADIITVQNLNNKGARWQLNEDKTEYVYRVYDKVPGMDGVYDWLQVSGTPSIAVGDEIAFSAAINN